MATAYCAQCKEKVEIKNPKNVTIDGKGAIQGVCPVCGTKVVRFVVSDEKVKEAVKSALEKAVPEPGTGQGAGEPRRREGGRDLCICPKCKQIHQHVRGTPCNQSVCSKCGTALVPYTK